MIKLEEHYNKAMIGETCGLEPNSEQVAVYDLNKMIDCLIEQDICQDFEEAEDMICYNASYEQYPHPIIIDLGEYDKKGAN